MVALDQALGRVLAEALAARLTQPPADVSAMDGYAVRAADVATLPAHAQGACSASPPASRRQGRSARAKRRASSPARRCRAGADTIVIQENTATRRRPRHRARRQPQARASISARAGSTSAPATSRSQAGRRLTARDIALAAAMNRPWLKVHSPAAHRHALAPATSSSIPAIRSGRRRSSAATASASPPSCRACGGEPINLGIARDDARRSRPRDRSRARLPTCW